MVNVTLGSSTDPALRGGLRASGAGETCSHLGVWGAGQEGFLEEALFTVEGSQEPGCCAVGCALRAPHVQDLSGGRLVGD